MKERIEFELNDYFMNAGICGLLKMLENDSNSKGRYECTGNFLSVDKDYLLETDLTELFIQTIIKEEQEEGKYPKILDKIEKTISIIENRELEKNEYQELTSTLKELEANCYQKIYEVLQNKNHYEVDLYQIIKRIKKERDQVNLKDNLTQIATILKDKEIAKKLFFREIAYRRINKFWDGISFLNRNNASKDIQEVHVETFESPFKEYLKKEKKKSDIVCEECGDFIKGKDCCDYSFLKGTTADIVRKKNDFWNYKVNSWICPKCRFLYSFIPLGFSKYHYKYLFLNSNTSIERLKNCNRLGEIVVEKANEKNVERKVYNQIVLNYIKKQQFIVENIEIVTAGENENRFSVNVIQKEILIFMKENMGLLERLMSYPSIKVNDEYVNVYDTVFKNILSLKDNYNLLHFILQRQLTTGDYRLFYPAKYVHEIQCHLSDKRRGDEKSMSKQIYVMRECGKELRHKILEAKKTMEEEVLNSLVYKLLNAARINDVDRFTDIVIRTCTSYGAKVPTIMLSGFEDKDIFANLAYAYILGIKDQYNENEKNMIESNEKEGINL